MNSLILTVLLSVPQQGIFGGFNLHWSNYGGLGEVALSAGSAVVNGNVVTNSPHGGYPLDSAQISPWVPDNQTIGLTYSAYCYVVMVGNLPGNVWFANNNGLNWDFVCLANNPTNGTFVQPTATGNPVDDIPYPPANPVTHVSAANAIFVGSVVGINVAWGTLFNGNPQGFSVNPFFRNGSQVIYTTNTNCPNCGVGQNAMNANWDVGVPAGQKVGMNHIGANTPIVNEFNFTDDGENQVLPLSASQAIFDIEGTSHQNEPLTLCFLDPNQPTIGPIANQTRSCQSEVIIEAAENGPFFPVTPFRAQVNIGNANKLGSPYGDVWIAGASAQNKVSRAYFDIAYRGYVEPERQLVSQLPRGVGSACNANEACPAGLDCSNGGCLIPAHSPNFQCRSASDCEPVTLTPLNSVACEEKICCNSLNEYCATEADCCTGYLCSNNTCVLETDHGYCSKPGDCASTECTVNWCTCIADNNPATAANQCCSDRLNGTKCGVTTLDSKNCTANSCNANTELCQANACCVTSQGSKLEPCAQNTDCCQSPVALACTSNTCCNIVNGQCQTNDDCCVSNICNAQPGFTGQCKINSLTGICMQDSDCISSSCNLVTGICN